MAKYQPGGNNDLTDDASGNRFGSDVNESSFNTTKFEQMETSTNVAPENSPTARIIMVNQHRQNVKFCSNSIR